MGPSSSEFYLGSLGAQTLLSGEGRSKTVDGQTTHDEQSLPSSVSTVSSFSQGKDTVDLDFPWPVRQMLLVCKRNLSVDGGLCSLLTDAQ